MMKQNTTLSPHIQIYSFPIFAVLSILHRISGLVLLKATALIPLLVFFAISCPGLYDTIYDYLQSSWLRYILSIFFLALSFHIFSGIRHILMDLGIGFDLKTATYICWATLFFTIALTIYLTKALLV